jgi:transcription initiation factor TFIIB
MIGGKKNSCMRCGKGVLVSDEEIGETCCSTCGFVLTEKAEDWQSFSTDEDKARTGAPTSLTMHDKGLSTVINPINKDASGKSINGPMKHTIERLRTWDSRSQAHEPVDRNFRQAFSELNRLKDKLAVTDAVIEKAAYIYRKALEKGLVRGRSISALMASALYAACRETVTPRNLKDVEKVANIKKKDIARCYRLLVKELELEMPVMDAVNCVSRIASRIEVGEKTKRYAIAVLKKAQKYEVSAGKDPMGLAAAALYLSCTKNDEDKTQRDISLAANVTEVTIRNRYKGLKESLEKLAEEKRNAEEGSRETSKGERG